MSSSKVIGPRGNKLRRCSCLNEPRFACCKQDVISIDYIVLSGWSQLQNRDFLTHSQGKLDYCSHFEKYVHQ